MGYYHSHSIWKILSKFTWPMAETVAVASEPGSYDEFLRDFRETLRDGSAQLRDISDEKSAEKLNGDWSCKEILGHLIDSAANNHQRFVRAQFTDHLDFPGYDQEQWVAAQSYSGEPWLSLVEFWRAYNTHLLHTVSVIPPQILTERRTRHSLDQIAFKMVDRKTPATLEYLIRDYLDHLKHHLSQIWRLTCPTATKN